MSTYPDNPATKFTAPVASPVQAEYLETYDPHNRGWSPTKQQLSDRLDALAKRVERLMPEAQRAVRVKALSDTAAQLLSEVRAQMQRHKCRIAGPNEASPEANFVVLETLRWFAMKTGLAPSAVHWIVSTDSDEDAFFAGEEYLCGGLMHETGEIFLRLDDSSIDDVGKALLHELAHLWQTHRDGPMDGDPERQAKREAEAEEYAKLAVPHLARHIRFVRWGV